MAEYMRDGSLQDKNRVIDDFLTGSFCFALEVIKRYFAVEADAETDLLL